MRGHPQVRRCATRRTCGESPGPPAAQTRSRHLAVSSCLPWELRPFQPPSTSVGQAIAYLAAGDATREEGEAYPLAPPLGTATLTDRPLANGSTRSDGSACVVQRSDPGPGTSTATALGSGNLPAW